MEGSMDKAAVSASIQALYDMAGRWVFYNAGDPRFPDRKYVGKSGFTSYFSTGPRAFWGALGSRWAGSLSVNDASYECSMSGSISPESYTVRRIEVSDPDPSTGHCLAVVFGQYGVSSALVTGPVFLPKFVDAFRFSVVDGTIRIHEQTRIEMPTAPGLAPAWL